MSDRYLVIKKLEEGEFAINPILNVKYPIGSIVELEYNAFRDTYQVKNRSNMYHYVQSEVDECLLRVEND